MASAEHVCAHCGDRIGVYEPIWLQWPDGSTLRTGLLSLPPRAQSATDLRLFHLACLSVNGDSEL